MAVLIVRLASASIVGALALALPRLTYHYVFLSVLFSHYLLAIIFSMGTIKSAWMSFRSRAGLLLTASAAVATAVFSVPSIVPFFGVHHALSECYAIWTRDEEGKQDGLTLAARFTLQLMAYLVAVRRDPNWPLTQSLELTAPLFTGLGVAVLFWLFRLPVIVRNGPGRIEQIGGELLAIAAAAASFFVPLGWTDLIFYHIATWTLLPLVLHTPRYGGRFICLYSLATVATIVIFAACTPLLSGSPLALASLDRIAIAWGFVHITSSFFLSRHNPLWLRRCLGTV